MVAVAPSKFTVENVLIDNIPVDEEIHFLRPGITKFVEDLNNNSKNEVFIKANFKNSTTPSQGGINYNRMYVCSIKGNVGRFAVISDTVSGQELLFYMHTPSSR